MSKVLGTWLLALSVPFCSVAQATSVLFLNPGESTETFWVSYTQFMQAGATDLGLDLRVQYAERQPATTLLQAREALQGPHRPDYLVVVNEQYVAPEILRLSLGSGVKLLLVNNTLTADQLKLLGDRGRSHPELLGSVVANDEEAGYRMLKELVRLREREAPGESIELLAFSGMKITPAAQLREKGLHRALAEHPNVRLRQLVYGEWSRERAYEQARQLFGRYPQIQLVWSANDEMALGAMQALEDTGRVPGKDVLFSAVNSSPAILQARIDGRLSVLMAGHFSIGGWAMVLLHDHAQGIDFTRYGGQDQQLPLLQLIDGRQARRLLDPGASRHYDVDFKALSAKGHAPGWRYPFSLQLLLR